jgi:hypothetical protein
MPPSRDAFNAKVLSYLRQHLIYDAHGRDELLTLAERRLWHMNELVGRERSDYWETDEDFIERRALVVVQYLRMEVREGMMGRQ